MKKNRHRLELTSIGALAILLLVLLQGCTAKSPILQDGQIVSNSEELDNRDERLRLSFLVKELVSKSNQEMVINQFAKTELVDHWSTSDYAVATNMMVDVIEDQMGSASGEILGSVVFLAGLLGPDGSKKWVDKVFLPKEVNGKILDTAENAEAYLHQLIASRSQKIAKTKGWSYRCIQDCGHNNAIYELSLPALPEDRLYKPDKVFIFVYTRSGLKAARPNLLRDAALGYPAAWEDNDTSSFIIRLFTEPNIDQSGNIILEKINDEKSYLHEANWLSIGKIGGLSGIGQEIMQGIFDNPNMIRGYGYGGINRVFYNGKIYHWRNSKAPDGFVYEEILE